MLDLGASINLMPYHVYMTLGLDDINHDIKISLRIVDQSLVYPREVVKNILVNIEELYIPFDFVILDMEESPHEEDEETHIQENNLHQRSWAKDRKALKLCLLLTIDVKIRKACTSRESNSIP